MTIIYRFQARLLDRIDKQIADAEQLLNADRIRTSAVRQDRGAEAVDEVQDLLIRMREHRRRVRRSFHLGR
jgi:hypothetical protein